VEKKKRRKKEKEKSLGDNDVSKNYKKGNFLIGKSPKKPGILEVETGGASTQPDSTVYSVYAVYSMR
jgi:hypothetical protein